MVIYGFGIGPFLILILFLAIYKNGGFYLVFFVLVIRSYNQERSRKGRQERRRGMGRERDEEGEGVKE